MCKKGSKEDIEAMKAVRYVPMFQVPFMHSLYIQQMFNFLFSYVEDHQKREKMQLYLIKVPLWHWKMKLQQLLCPFHQGFLISHCSEFILHRMVTHYSPSHFCSQNLEATTTKKRKHADLCSEASKRYF